jgi:hypothetical protein
LRPERAIYRLKNTSLMQSAPAILSQIPSLPHLLKLLSHLGRFSIFFMDFEVKKVIFTRPRGTGNSKRAFFSFPRGIGKLKNALFMFLRGTGKLKNALFSFPRGIGKLKNALFTFPRGIEKTKNAVFSRF